MSITRVALVTGLTVRAIRYYEERGLVEPARDRYRARLYDRAARERLTRIAVLRGCGLSLEDIEAVLDDDGDDKFATLLSARRASLAGQLAIVDELMAQMRDDRSGRHGAC
jgi:MerR family redox-sensitive transcriptional activator SoxR